MSEDEKLAEKIDFDSIFDLKLSVQEYSEKLQELLDNSGLGIVEKRKLFRQKTQEFKDEKRKPHHEIEEGQKYY
ncbi:MAG: hypothetical protein EU532_11890 [Promethearchaeota archaeon]|nr:MAG: hypothetical protein EU532_11890 [Candidatus Lokiarchaeota archaeon]